MYYIDLNALGPTGYEEEMERRLNPPISDRFTAELWRKSFHLMGVAYIATVWVCGRAVSIKIFTALTCVELLIELCRFYSPAFNFKMVEMFGKIIREEEVNRISGIFWTLAGITLMLRLISDEKIIFCALSYLVFGDLAASLVGLRWGRIKYFGKSLEGSIAFFVVALCIGLYFFNPVQAVLGAFVAALIEFFPLPWNDNFWIPLLSALFLRWLTY